MAKPKKYPEVMELAAGSGQDIRGERGSVLRAITGYGQRCNPKRAFSVGESMFSSQGFVRVTRLPDPEPQP